MYQFSVCVSPFKKNLFCQWLCCWWALNSNKAVNILTVYISSTCTTYKKNSFPKSTTNTSDVCMTSVTHTTLTSLLTWGCPVLHSICVLPTHTVCCSRDRHSVWIAQVQETLQMVSILCSFLNRGHGGTVEQTTGSGWEPSSWIHHQQCPHLPKPGPKEKW